MAHAPHLRRRGAAGPRRLVSTLIPSAHGHQAALPVADPVDGRRGTRSRRPSCNRAPRGAPDTGVRRQSPTAAASSAAATVSPARRRDRRRPSKVKRSTVSALRITHGAGTCEPPGAEGFDAAGQRPGRDGRAQACRTCAAASVTPLWQVATKAPGHGRATRRRSGSRRAHDAQRRPGPHDVEARARRGNMRTARPAMSGRGPACRYDGIEPGILLLVADHHRRPRRSGATVTMGWCRKARLFSVTMICPCSGRTGASSPTMGASRALPSPPASTTAGRRDLAPGRRLDAKPPPPRPDARLTGGRADSRRRDVAGLGRGRETPQRVHVAVERGSRWRRPPPCRCRAAGASSRRGPAPRSRSRPCRAVVQPRHAVDAPLQLRRPRGTA